MNTSDFTQTYIPLRASLYRVAFALLESEAAAEDAVQDLYIKLWERRDDLDGVQNPLAYSVTLLRNLCIDRLRRNARIEHGSPPPDTITEEGSSIESRESLQRVIEAMQKLPEKQRIVMRMKVFEEKSYEEIANATGLSQINLRVLLSIARKKIKEAL